MCKRRKQQWEEERGNDEKDIPHKRQCSADTSTASPSNLAERVETDEVSDQRAAKRSRVPAVPAVSAGGSTQVDAPPSAAVERKCAEDSSHAKQTAKPDTALLRAALLVVLANKDLSAFTLRNTKRELEQHFKMTEGELESRSDEVRELAREIVDAKVISEKTALRDTSAVTRKSNDGKL